MIRDRLTRPSVRVSLERIYFDNAATSWPKPPAVYDAVMRAMKELGAPAGRSTYAEAVEVERLIADTRRQVAALLGANDPRRIVFTANATDSLNLAIHGSLAPGDHVITTVAEHNSVLRPLSSAENRLGIETTYVGCDGCGIVDPDEIQGAVRPNTRMIVLTHASNVTGSIQPVEQVGRIAADRGLLFLVDAAQTLGHWPVDVAEIGCSMLAAPGHKGLLGPLGLGLLYLAPGVEQQLQDVRQGGTGTISESARQPDSMPDKYEAGNHNVPAILGLHAGLAYIASVGLSQLQDQQRSMMALLLEGFQSLAEVTIHARPDADHQVGVASISVSGYDPQEVASILDSAFRIQVRSGLHCAPEMHRSLGTLDSGGTVRFSLGPFNNADQIQLGIDAVRQLAISH